MHVKHIWLVLSTALLLTGMLVSCTGNPPRGQATPAVTAAPAAGGGNAYPATGGGNGAYPAPAGSAYPGPAANGPTADPAYPNPQPSPAAAHDPVSIPQPAAGMGVVHGKIYSATTDAPIYDGVTVYLSKVIKTDSNTIDAVSLDIKGDSKTTPDNQGVFAFADVPPGRYGIVVKGPLNQYLARRSDDRSKDAILTVDAGQTVDLGKIYSGYP